ncbi:MAG TPA: universal stress protein [bacterium]|nr:universal stress protein [bacterium]
MFERILVPLDGSQLAEVALPYAEELAARLGSQLTLLHISEWPGFEDQYHNMRQFYVQKMGEHAQRDIQRRLRKQLTREIRVKSETLSGRPAESIIDYADEEKMGLIVMSTHGRTGVGRWAIGSVAYKVVTAARQPVYLVRARGTRSDMRKKSRLDRILVPLDGSKQSEAVIPYVEALGSGLQANVTLLQALTPDYGVTSGRQLEQLEAVRTSAKDYIENLVARFRAKGITARDVLAEALLDPTEVAREIDRYADEIKADLVVMSATGRSASNRAPGDGYAASLGSIAEKMVHSGNTPLLLVKA